MKLWMHSQRWHPSRPRSPQTSLSVTSTSPLLTTKKTGDRVAPHMTPPLAPRPLWLPRSRPWTSSLKDPRPTTSQTGAFCSYNVLSMGLSPRIKPRHDDWLAAPRLLSSSMVRCTSAASRISSCGASPAVGYFKRKQKNPQAHGYRCSLHLGVFQSIDFPQGT